WQVAVRESRNMHQRITSMQAEARDAFEHILESAGALAFVYEYSESAASPALYNAFAERKPACPLTPLYHILGDHTCSHTPSKPLRPLLASTGRMPNTIFAYKLLARSDGSSSCSNTAPRPSMRGSRPCACASTDNPSRCAWNSRKGPSWPRCAPTISL